MTEEFPVPNCPMRHQNGICKPVGGTCSTNKALCKALQAAYTIGSNNAYEAFKNRFNSLTVGEAEALILYKRTQSKTKEG